MINVNYRTNVLLNQILRKTLRMNGKRTFLSYKIISSSNIKPKKSPVKPGIFKWVIEGARTPDPQNHNLML